MSHIWQKRVGNELILTGKNKISEKGEKPSVRNLLSAFQILPVNLIKFWKLSRYTVIEFFVY